MIRLLSIEFLKLRYTKYFWVLSILFIVVLIALPISVRSLTNYLTEIGEQPFGIDITANQIPIFDFVDLWQNMTYIYAFFSIFLGFISVISICNEFTYGTIKQNVIDGLSRQELFLSKFLYIVAISVLMSIVVLLIGLVTGFFLSPVTGWPFIIQNIEFIPAYALHLIGFQLFCMLIALLIKRPGICLALLMFYIYFLEPIGVGLLKWEYELPMLADFLPMKAIGNVIPNPFGKYILREAESFVPWDHLIILLVYTALIAWVAHRLLTKRDLR